MNYEKPATGKPVISNVAKKPSLSSLVPQKSIERILEDEKNFQECGRNLETYHAIFGAPGEFPAMEN